MSTTRGAGTGRFSKGRSGNPKGRPKKPPAEKVSAFDIVIDRKLTVTRNGQPREITVEEGLQHRTYQDAIAGKRMAQREVLKWIMKRENLRAKQATKSTTRIIGEKISPDPENAEEALLILGIASRDMRWAVDDPDTVRLQLEPWAVQAALARRRSTNALPEQKIADINRCTRNSESLRWPKGTRA